MTKVFAGAENIISSLGFTSDENIGNIIRGKSGIVLDDSGMYSPSILPLSKVDHDRLESIRPLSADITRMERMFIASILDAGKRADIDLSSPETLFILTTTKGNIDLLDPVLQAKFGKNRIYLHSMAKVITTYFNNPNKAIIVSNACISGVLGIIYGERLIRAGKYKHIVVSGGDLMSEFIVSGFQSFQSLSEQACKPFDRDRTGLTLGEGAASIILSSSQGIFKETPVKVLGGAGSNDGNHISGPSRTGEGLLVAIQQAMKLSGLTPEDIDTISAHGTATDYNDEMEAKAFSRAGLEEVPLNSYKAYIGHTLGAAGVIEAAISLQSMKRNMLFRSAGYDHHGVSKSIHVIKENIEKEVSTCLKTGSGFGGSNAAVILQKI
ncbi:MAG: beta-ketoacyl synthase [Bacteroidetes bacterium]|nr:MAG: beta-ketoacyl synthase [Bacteroidota bacterium]